MKLFFALLIPFCFVYCDDSHSFAGKHFLGSYIGCNQKAMADLTGMLAAMDEAVKSSGATILDRAEYIFSPHAITVVYLLSESHASLHTYPEYGACFVDLFTCGDRCTAEDFDRALRAYLQPSTVNARLFVRNEGVEEIAFETASTK